jgi:hypothetical protein
MTFFFKYGGSWDLQSRTGRYFIFFSIRRFYEKTPGIILILLGVPRSSLGVLPENACSKTNSQGGERLAKKMKILTFLV